MRAAQHDRFLRAMLEAVDRELEAAATGGRRAVFGVDATRVARGPGGCLYRVDPPPEVTLVEDAPVRLSAGARAGEGRLGPVADESCLVEIDQDLGPRVLEGRLVVDNLGPLQGLRARLQALEGGVPSPASFRFDQAALALGAPAGRLRDRIAAAADSADEWSFDDRTGDVLRAALRQRWATVQAPPGTDSAVLVARLLDQLLALEARVLFVAPTGYAVDRTVGALCDRLSRIGRLHSGVVQRVGSLVPGAVRDRYGPFVDAAAIAADLRAGIETRLADLDRVEGRLRYEELDRRATELDRHVAELEGELRRTVGTRVARRSRGVDPDTLVIRRHEVLRQVRSARQEADRIAEELAAAGGQVPTVEDLVGAGGTRADRRRRLAAARRELIAARKDVEPALRARARLVAATARGAYLRGLPRAEFDVVVLAGPVLPPEAYYLAGLSTRSVIGVGDSSEDRPTQQRLRRVPHPQEPPRRRPGGSRVARPHRGRPPDLPPG